MRTRRSLSSGNNAPDARSRLTVSMVRVAPRPGLSASITWVSRLNVSTSGCAPRRTFRQARHSPHGADRSARFSFVQQSDWAKARAAAALPTPFGPDSRYACPILPPRIASRSRLAAAGSIQSGQPRSAIATGSLLARSGTRLAGLTSGCPPFYRSTCRSGLWGFIGPISSQQLDDPLSLRRL
jgi:hypothetical protein